MTPLLPPELVHQILAHVEVRKDNPQGNLFEYPQGDLSACSLVCHSWNEIVRHYLFRDIVYTFVSVNRAGMEPWDDRDALLGFKHWVGFPSEEYLVDPNVIQPTKTLPMLTDFLRTKPRYASCIRTLALRGSPHAWHRSARESYTFSYDEDLYDDPDVVAELLAELPSLSSLTLQDVFLGNPSGLATPIQLPFASLRYLSILFPTSSQEQGYHLVRFMSRLCRVEELHVSDVGWGSRSRDPFGGPVVLQQVETVVAHGVSPNDGLLRHLLDLNPNSLVLNDPSHHDFPVYADYLRRSGASLRKLQMELVAINLASRTTPLSLSACANLESFSYTLEPYHNTLLAAWTSVDVLETMLASLLVSENACLREVTLRIPMDEGGNFPEDEGGVRLTEILDGHLTALVTKHKAAVVRTQCEGNPDLCLERRSVYLARTFPLLVNSGYWEYVNDVSTSNGRATPLSYLPAGTQTQDKRRFQPRDHINVLM